MIIEPYEKKLDLRHAPTIWEFMNDSSFVRVIFGPVGSGKSTGMCAEGMKLSCLQEPGEGNIRYSKGGVIRNTYGELQSTTLKTWAAMFPENICGPIRHSAPITHHIKIPAIGDQPGFDLLVEFMALDRPKDVRKLLSWEGSWIWINEGREVERSVVEACTARVGRYPSIAQGGVKCTRKAILIDTNQPEEDHYLLEMKNEGPLGWSFYEQPPAVVEARKAKFNYNKKDIIPAAGTSFVINPQAENLPNLPDRYYEDLMPGKKRDWIQVYTECKPGFVKDGKPVIPEYDDNVMSRHDLPVLKGVDLLLGADIGGGTLAPSGIIFQRHPRGIWLIHAEVVCYEMGLDRFSTEVNMLLAELFPGRKISRGWGDPAGAKRDEIFETAAFKHLRAKGIPIYAAPTNNIKARVEAITAPMNRLIDGMPGILIAKRCKVLRAGLSGKWMYKRLQVAGSERYAEKPDKGKYSHPCDALGYGLCGGGEYRVLQGRKQITRGGNQTHVAQTDFSVF